MNLTVDDIIKATSGKFFGNIQNNLNNIIEGVCIDSRQDVKNKLFVPIKGKNFDGHDFIQMAFEKDATICLSENIIDTKNCYILVKDTKQALLDIAQYYRSLFDIKVIAVTGSSGKTTIKDMIAHILSKKFDVLKTELNQNNEIGVPLTIFKITQKTQVVVLELGMNHLNEIHNLSKVAKPDICIISNIGTSHIEYLGSKENILKAKLEILDYLEKDGICFLNSDDEMLRNLQLKEKNVLFYGIDNPNSYIKVSDIKYDDLNGSIFSVKIDYEEFDIKINIPGKHMILNSIVSVAISKLMKISNQDIIDSLQSFEASKMRMQIINSDKYTILNDTYNANPESMKVALDVLSMTKGNKVCILGDMLELGDESKKLHYELGQYAYEKSINVIICVGENAYDIYEGASVKLVSKDNSDEQRIIYFENKEILFNNLDNILQDGDTILIKASRGMKFEDAVEKITQE